MHVDVNMLEWARAQFAMTALFHFFFVPFTLGMSFVVAFFETIYVKTGKEEWKNITQFWQLLFAINFALGLSTGIIHEFEFGTNWSTYSWVVGDLFGAPLAIEGIVAFFMKQHLRQFHSLDGKGLAKVCILRHLGCLQSVQTYQHFGF